MDVSNGHSRWHLAFSSYLQAIIDLLIPGQTSGIKEDIVDLYNKPELLFFGPDGECWWMSVCVYLHCCITAEGTADMMDWAACMFSSLLLPPASLILKVFRFSACPRAWCWDLVEVIYHRKERRAPWRSASWCLWHDILISQGICRRYLQAAWFAREKRHKSADWRAW